MLDNRVHESQTSHENLGLIIALLAAAFAGVSGWEAYRTRVEAILSLKIAQRSYIEITDVKSVVSWHGYADGGPRIDYSFVVRAYGNSPAFQVRQVATCEWGDIDLQYPTTTDVKLSAEHWGPDESFLNLVASQFPSGTEQLVQGSCPFLKESWVLDGVVFYNDIFGDANYTHFCYVAYPVEEPNVKTESTRVYLRPCWQFDDVSPVK